MKSPIVFLFSVFLLFWLTSFSAVAQTEKEMIRKVRETKGFENKVLNMLVLGDFYTDKNLLKTQEIRDKINVYRKHLSPETRMEIAIFNAEVARLERNFEAIYTAVSPFEKYKFTPSQAEKQLKILQNLGYYHTVVRNYNLADSILKEVLQLCKKTNNQNEYCRTYCYLSYNETLNANKEYALNFTNKAFESAKTTKRNINFALCYYFQSGIYDFFGQPDIALSRELLAYKYAKNCRNFALLPIIAKRIGDKQILIQNFKEALFYYESFHHYAKSYVDKRLEGLALVSQSNVKRLQKKYKDGIELNMLAINLLKEVENSGSLGIAELNLAKIYVDTEEDKKALYHLDLALKHLKKSINEEVKAEVYMLKGKIAKTQGQYEASLNFFNQSISIQEKLGHKEKVYELYPFVSEIYKIVGDKKNAFHYLEKYMTFSETNNKKIASRRIAEWNEMYRNKQRDQLIAYQTSVLEKQKHEKELTKTKLENITLKNNQQKYIIFGFIFLVILGTILLISRNRRIVLQQKRREAEMSQVLLRTQMNPHFIFNAMSVIHSYIYENDIENSSLFLVNFSRLMRLILENSSKEFIPLSTEIEILEKYLETQKLRFEERFEFEINCSDNIKQDKVQIPPMITQPFIENSIEHGQLHTFPDGKIIVRFSMENNYLKIEIEDNGIGREKSEKLKDQKSHNSLATHITRDRIKMLNDKYFAQGDLIIEDADKNSKTGTLVVITLPYITMSN